jgi:hypothetical protein
VTEAPLTPRLLAKIRLLFGVEDRAFVEELLLTRCGPNTPAGLADAMWIERVRAAALKFSQGSLGKLAEAIELGNRDWRDLLMGAGFGDLKAHDAWLDAPVISC